MSSKKALVVLGMHRSGTSSVAGMLSILGASAPQTLLSPSPDNPKGFWESRLVVEANDQLLSSAGSYWSDWRKFDFDATAPDLAAHLHQMRADILRSEFGEADTIVLKDPRLCRLFPAWEDALAEQGYGLGFVMPIRSPLEVAGSLQRRNDFSIAEGLLLWLRHVLDAELVTRGRRRHIMMWPDFMENWRKELARLGAALNWEMPALGGAIAVKIDTFLSRDLRNENVSDSDLRDDPQVHAWVNEVYAAFKILAKRDGDAEVLARLDRLRSDFDLSSKLYFPAYGAVLLREHHAATARDHWSQQAVAAGQASEALTASLAQRDQELIDASARHEALRQGEAVLAQKNAALTDVLASQARTIEEVRAASDALQARLEATVAENKATVVENTERTVQLEQQLSLVSGERAAALADAHALEVRLAALDAELQVRTTERDALRHDLSVLTQNLRERPMVTAWKARRRDPAPQA